MSDNDENRKQGNQSNSTRNNKGNSGGKRVMKFSQLYEKKFKNKKIVDPELGNVDLRSNSIKPTLNDSLKETLHK